MAGSSQLAGHKLLTKFCSDLMLVDTFNQDKFELKALPTSTLMSIHRTTQPNTQHNTPNGFFFLYFTFCTHVRFEIIWCMVSITTWRFRRDFSITNFYSKKRICFSQKQTFHWKEIFFSKKLKNPSKNTFFL